MTRFPTTPDFTGLNAPVRIEWQAFDLEVEGTIPDEIEGAFFRAVPDPAHPPLADDDTLLSGDGMLSRFLFRGGHVEHAIRYVRTARFEAERKAGHTLFGRYRNPFTDRPEAAGVDRTVANTTPVWHAGRLFMTKEDGRAYEMDPLTLETIGPWDFHGALRSETMTAHVRVDPDTQEMFFFGYEAGGLCSDDVAYCIADSNGALTSEQWFKAPYCGLMHDFVITENYAIFPVFPTTADLDRLKAGGDHWVHEQDRESWVGVMPRYGKVEELRWFRGPPGASAFHMMNAYEADGKVHMDLCWTDTQAFPFIRRASGIERNQWEIQGGLMRWTMDFASNEDGIGIAPLGPPGDMPRIRDRDQGRPYDSAWYLSMNPEGGPPLMGGPVGAAFNCMFKIHFPTGRLEVMGLPPRHGISEPVHVASRTPGHDGWLIAVVDHETGESSFASELWIIDAGNIAAGAVAKIKVPIGLRPQVHGWWVSADQLAGAAVVRKEAA